MIKSADKGGGIVIQNRADYVAETVRVLSDAHTYTKQKLDPLPEFTLEATALAGDLEDKVITSQEASFLVKQIHSTLYFYHLPKVHKYTTNSPALLIVAAMDSITSGFTLYIDQFP